MTNPIIEATRVLAEAVVGATVSVHKTVSAAVLVFLKYLPVAQVVQVVALIQVAQVASQVEAHKTVSIFESLTQNFPAMHEVQVVALIQVAQLASQAFNKVPSFQNLAVESDQQIPEPAALAVPSLKQKRGLQVAQVVPLAQVAHPAVQAFSKEVSRVPSFQYPSVVAA